MEQFFYLHDVNFWLSCFGPSFQYNLATIDVLEFVVVIDVYAQPTREKIKFYRTASKGPARLVLMPLYSSTATFLIRSRILRCSCNDRPSSQSSMQVWTLWLSRSIRILSSAGVSAFLLRSCRAIASSITGKQISTSWRSFRISRLRLAARSAKVFQLLLQQCAGFQGQHGQARLGRNDENLGLAHRAHRERGQCFLLAVQLAERSLLADGCELNPLEHSTQHQLDIPVRALALRGLARNDTIAETLQLLGGGQAVLLEHAECRQADSDRRGCALAGAAGPADVRGDEHHRAAALQLELDEEVPIVLEPRPDDAAVAADREPELTRRLGRVEVECDFHDRSFHGLQSISLTD